MAKKPVITDEYVSGVIGETPNGTIYYENGVQFSQDDLPLARLMLSDIITIDNGVITWRTGHLEHIANLYAGDPATTERDYADDLAVARAYSREQWEALIAPPQA